LRIIYFCLALLSFTFMPAFCFHVSADPDILWHTFLGSGELDAGFSVAADASGNLYVTGLSYDTWGSPINAYAGWDDAVVAKLNSNGVLQWHTFLGSSSQDNGYSVAADHNGNLYVAGNSDASWGSPINAHTAGGQNAFVAKLDSSGVLQWHTFLPGEAAGGNAIAANANGNLYVAGRSGATWGSPINAHAGGLDAFVASLDSSGILQWHTFLGSDGTDIGHSAAADASGNLYVTGESDATWGSPTNAHAGGENAFVAKLDSGGVLQWHTFLGSGIGEWGYCIAANTSNNLYVTGNANASWGSPINAHSGGLDAFVARIDDLDIADDGCLNDVDGCPYDLHKCDPGTCGCGTADTDSDGDGTADCNDDCPTDPNKTDPGTCGCGTADTDSDGDGTPNCNDACPTDSEKINPRACGCVVLDTDTDTDGTPNCIDPDDDGDGIDDSTDAFPTDAGETADNDQDGIGDNGDSDDDNDGSADSLEMAGPGNGDGNGDGIADSLQSHVSTLALPDKQQYCTLELPAGHNFGSSG
jgi:Beta-propeller repeat